ncbi:MAG: hypothetical protein E7474_09390 [Ruminococcaceae bacterium]|nr:hypothetical protein [Oscillospiraceae bacterium]
MKDRKIYCMNEIAEIGTSRFRPRYTLTGSVEEAAGILVRSADMREMTFPPGRRRATRAQADGKSVKGSAKNSKNTSVIRLR